MNFQSIGLAIFLLVVFILLVVLWFIGMGNAYHCDRDNAKECWCGDVHYHPMASDRENVKYEK